MATKKKQQANGAEGDVIRLTLKQGSINDYINQAESKGLSGDAKFDFAAKEMQRVGFTESVIRGLTV